ncbi:hypothetical protein [Methylobacterium fujisawaense]|uniref:hypothetical protein n=1 Tax=Methylobacterium fujisawaense TaxID=107400 RepID=UPI002F352161
MRAKILVLSLGLICAGAGPVWAARPILDRLPSAVAQATPGTGSAPILSAGIAGAPALTVLARPGARAARASAASGRSEPVTPLIP